MIDNMRQQLQMCSQVYERLTAELVEKNLPDARRRELILALRSMFRLRRKSLRDAESSGTMPPTEAAKLWREFARGGLAVCDEQEAFIFERTHAPELPVKQRCSLVRTFSILLAMSRQLERDLDRASAGTMRRRKRQSIKAR